MPNANISKLPLGLLGFLGIQAGGKYPSLLGDTIAPTWDLLNLLAGAHATGISGVAIPNLAVGFNTVGLVVPETEIWYVTMCHAVAATGAAEAASFALAVEPSVGAAVGLTSNVIIGANEASWFATVYEPFWLSPGDDLGIQCSAFTGTVVGNVRCRRIVLPI